LKNGSITGGGVISSGPVVTDTVSNVATTSATLGGHVTSSSGYSNPHFEWGSDTSYGNTAISDKSSSSGGTDYFTASLAGLQPSTSYHFRFAATISGTAAYGSDQTFTTVESLTLTPPVIT